MRSRGAATRWRSSAATPGGWRRRAAGARAIAIPLDVGDGAAVDAAAAQVEEELGPIDVWVNNAMAAMLAFVHETDPVDYRRVMEVTHLGQVHGALAALKRMRPRDRGVIVMVGSALAYRAIPLQASYCAAKHATRAFSDALRCELMHEGSGVRVTSVHLPGLNTPQFGWARTTLRRHPRPVAPVYQPEVCSRRCRATAARMASSTTRPRTTPTSGS